MEFKHVLAAALLVALVLGGAPALAAIADHAAPVEDEVPVTTDGAPTITLVAEDGAEVDLVDMWGDDTLEIETDAGEAVVTGDDGASAHIAVEDLEGEETQLTEIDAGGNWLEVDPGDKNRLDVRGDADTLAFGDIEVDNDETDIQISGTEGGSAELRLHDLESDTEFVFYDSTGDVYLGTFETDSDGTGAGDVDLQDGSHALEIRTLESVDEPVLSNPHPEGEITERPDELVVDVDAEAYPVTVEFELEGEDVGEVELEEDGTASVDLDEDDVESLGSYDWEATVTDDVGQTDTIEVSFETPREITVREEHDPEDVINDVTLTFRFFSSDGSVVIERETDDGTIDMEGLPDSDFVVFAQSDEHYDRRIFIESIFEQEDMFLLNEEEFPRGENDAISSRFVYEDLTGQFPREETTIQIQRAIDLDGDGQSEWQTVSGDFWGAGGEFETILERGERYRVVLVNQETGATDNVGTHIPTEDLTHEIRTSGLVQEAENASGVYADAQLDENASMIDVVYSDPTNETGDLTIRVESRDGDTVLLEEEIDEDLGTYRTAISLDDEEVGEDWVVHFESERHTSSIPVGSGSVPLPVNVADWVMGLLMAMAVTFVGALYGPRTALLGAWAMVFVAAGASMFGWAFSPAAVVIAALIAVGSTLITKALP